MAIKINDIPPEGLTLELARKLDLFDRGTASEEFSAVLTIKPEGEGLLHLSGRVKANPVLECSRCLKQFPYPVDTELNIDLAPAASIGTAPEHELDHSELEMEFYTGDEIDPVEYIKEQVLITIPMVPLHRSDCKGLCPVCGTDLNEADCSCRKDGGDEFKPFAALKDLLKK
ncbi:MAG TPA: DUF177 domain-containing protein [Nitrospirota bacterium]